MGYEVHDSLLGILVLDPKLMTSSSYHRQGPRRRKRKDFSSLEPSQQETSLKPSFPRKGRRLYFSMEPDEGLLLFHANGAYVGLDILSTCPQANGDPDVVHTLDRHFPSGSYPLHDRPH